MTTEDVIREVRAHFSGAVSEIKMFGGIGFMLNGNMVAAVSKRGLLLRVGKARHEQALARADTRPMEMRGRTMEGYVYVDPPALTEDVLAAWLEEARAFVQTLPPKAEKAKLARKNRA